MSISHSQNIPSFSLTRQNQNLKKQINEAIAQLVEKGAFILGDNVKRLESNIASLCGTKYGIGVANGSDALYLALLACGIGPGDEVITTPFTFFATAGSIARTGAKPVFVDIDPETLNINPSTLKSKITTHTKAIIPVHLYGCPCDMDPIMEIADKYNLKVIEDAAQALGAKYKKKKVCGIGDAGCISFFPTKNLGAFGDGGMVVTNDAKIAERVRMLRVHGAKVKYYHDVLGCNSRLDEIQAAVLSIKLVYLNDWLAKRREIARLYNELLREIADKCDMDIKLPVEPPYAYHIYHQYTVQTENRSKLQKHLKDYGIGSAVYYPLPLHLQKVFKDLGYKRGDFPVSEIACEKVLSLPMFPELTTEEVWKVIECVKCYFKK